MNQLSRTEIWQVEVGGQIYDAPFDELSEWIAEGSLLPSDKVRKGNLRWVEAQLVPMLLPFFNAKAASSALVVTASTPDPNRKANSTSVSSCSPGELCETATQPTTGTVCSIHSDLPAVYHCTSCTKFFCRACPHSYGSSVRICPDCGQLCRSIQVHGSSGNQVHGLEILADEQFGSADLLAALRHPLRFRSSLIMGGTIFAFLSVGQSVSALGGIFMMVAALFCLMSANALSFGVLANTIDNFAAGKTDTDFFPDFGDFSIWESIVQPFFLSAGAYAVSFGPFILTLLVALYLVTSSIESHNQAVLSDLEKIPGTNYYAGRQIADQSQDVKKVLGDIAEKRETQVRSVIENGANGNSEPIQDEEAKEQEKLWTMAQEYRKTQLESALGKTKETRQKEYDEMVSGFLELAAPVFVIAVITFLWGAFFFPAASAVAGYTRSFAATVNPTVGLDTIRRLGLDYAKILGMGLFLVLIYGIISGLLSFVLSPFDLPGSGNLPAKAITSFFVFYLFAVFSCLLGLVFFKASDRLKLPS